MRAYPDEENHYLSPFPPPSAGNPTHRAQSRARQPAPRTWAARMLGKFLPERLTAWLQRQTHRLELQQMDDRSLADLGINRGDFPAILSGTYIRNGDAVPGRPAQDPPRGQDASRAR